MVVAQKVKEAEITDQDSLLLMKIKKLMPLDAMSRRLIDWMEKGVYDVLQKKYLKTLLFCICESVDGAKIEEYSFSFTYSNSDSQEVSLNINRTGNKKQGKAFNCKSTSEVTPNQMRSSACKMVRTLVQLMRTLDKMPEEMKLLYYDDVTFCRKIINKMMRDGFVEAKGNRRLGKRVIRSKLTEKKLLEVQRALNNDPMDMATNEPHNKTNRPEMHKPGSNLRDMSTFGALRNECQIWLSI